VMAVWLIHDSVFDRKQVWSCVR